MEIKDYFSKVSFGKKGTFPLVKITREDDVGGVVINPQYVVAIEIIVSDPVTQPLPTPSTSQTPPSPLSPH